jgi:redox-sensitive bicupin YhaK (pirin superfamily)
MPPDIEDGPAAGQYVPPNEVPQFDTVGGNVKILLGSLDNTSGQLSSPILSHQDMNYMVVTLAAGANWTYTPPERHDVAFAVGFGGRPEVNGITLEHEIAILDGRGSINISAGTAEAKILLGSATKHSHQLVLGSGSVHTSETSLRAGMQTIRNIGAELKASGRLK